DMGQAIAKQLKRKGMEVYTALEKRSARTRSLALEAQVTDVESLDALVSGCDILLSIMDPAAALSFASECSDAIKRCGRGPLFVDCNSVAPGTMHQIEQKIVSAGGRCADGGIIGGAPHGKGKILFCVSGKDAQALEQLATPQVVIRVVS